MPAIECGPPWASVSRQPIDEEPRRDPEGDGRSRSRRAARSATGRVRGGGRARVQARRAPPRWTRPRRRACSSIRVSVTTIRRVGPRPHHRRVRRCKHRNCLQHAHRADRDACARGQAEQVVAQGAVRERARAQEDRHQQHGRDGRQEQLERDRRHDRDQTTTRWGSTRASQTMAVIASVPMRKCERAPP